MIRATPWVLCDDFQILSITSSGLSTSCWTTHTLYPLRYYFGCATCGYTGLITMRNLIVLVSAFLTAFITLAVLSLLSYRATAIGVNSIAFIIVSFFFFFFFFTLTGILSLFLLQRYSSFQYLQWMIADSFKSTMDKARSFGQTRENRRKSV